MSNPIGPVKKAGGMTVREAGQKGGETVKKKYGPEFYEQIGRKGGQATKNAHGHAFYEQIGKKGGKKGGEATRDRYGPNFYEQIGQKGGQKVKQLIEEGKRAAAAAAEAQKKASKNRTSHVTGARCGSPRRFNEREPSNGSRYCRSKNGLKQSATRTLGEQERLAG